MSEMSAIEITERVSSALSLIGFCIIAFTYLGFQSFHRKEFNRLMFYASFGNMGSNIATMMSTAGIKAGPESATCKAQAFLIQWFMSADALWALCMSFNVYLAFRTTRIHFNLRQLGYIYLGVCYVVPFVPAFVYLVLDISLGLGIYGEATLWCWVSRKHKWLRIITFYGPVWFVLAVVASVYVWTGASIKRDSIRNKKIIEQLRNRASPSPNYSSETIIDDMDDIAGKIFYNQEVLLTSEPNSPWPPGTASCAAWPSSRPVPPGLTVLFPTQPLPAIPALPRHHSHMCTPDLMSSNGAARTYRVRNSQATYFTATVSSCPANTPRSSRTNRGACTFATVAFLIFCALFVVWIPATVNRIWGLMHSDTQENMHLNITAALVLPLQGFFNCLVYLFFSRDEIYREYQTAISTLASLVRRRILHHIVDVEDGRGRGGGGGGKNGSGNGNGNGSGNGRASREAISLQELVDLNPAFDADGEFDVCTFGAGFADADGEGDDGVQFSFEDVLKMGGRV